MTDRFPRREALFRLAVFAALPATVASLASCKSKPNCNDLTGLSTDEVNQRQNVAQYTEHAADPAKKCSACVQFLPGAQNACATCKVVKGPIDPEGGCKLWVAKPA